MKVYHIRRNGPRPGGGVMVTVSNKAGEESTTTNYELTPGASLKVRNHSPDGFEFGYGGSGPAQLALAILMDATGGVPEPGTYQDFKSEFIATIQGDYAELDEREIVCWLAQRDFPKKEGS